MADPSAWKRTYCLDAVPEVFANSVGKNRVEAACVRAGLLERRHAVMEAWAACPAQRH